MLNTLRRLLPTVAVTVPLLVAVPWLATVQAATSGGFVITSDRLEMDEEKRTAVFTGSVQAEEQNMQLSSDKMTFNYFHGRRTTNSKAAGNQGGVDKVLAEGGVVLIQGESRGTADEMLYRVSERTLEMRGTSKNAVIVQGADRLEGEKILLTLGSDRRIVKVSVLGGGQRRVSARINTDTEENDGSGNTNTPTNSFLKPGKAPANRTGTP